MKVILELQYWPRAYPYQPKRWFFADSYTVAGQRFLTVWLGRYGVVYQRAELRPASGRLTIV
jgi:hypothetical protein